MIEATILLTAIAVGLLIQLHREQRKNREWMEDRHEDLAREQHQLGMREAEKRQNQPK